MRKLKSIDQVLRTNEHSTQGGRIAMYAATCRMDGIYRRGTSDIKMRYNLGMRAQYCATKLYYLYIVILL